LQSALSAPLYSSKNTSERERERVREREREEFIFHIATTLEQAHSRNTKLGGLPERHLAHIKAGHPACATVSLDKAMTSLASCNGIDIFMAAHYVQI